MSVRLRVTPAEITADPISVDGERHHYLTRVLRLTIGAEVEVFDGDGLARSCKISSIDKQWVTLVASSAPHRATAPALRLVSVLPLIKGERMDWAITKLTELGVSEIVPVHTARTVVTVKGERAEKRRLRFERLGEAAARQSGRAVQPVIHPIGVLEEALATWGTSPTSFGRGPRLIFSPHRDARGLRGLVGSDDSNDAELVVCVTGPEGGFADGELEESATHGFELSRLGNAVLRAETAAVSAVAAVSALIGDLGAETGPAETSNQPVQNPPSET